MQYFTPEPYRGTEPKNKTASESGADGDKTLWQHLMDRPRPTITTARSAALNGLDDSLLKEINDVLRQTADNGGMATDGTTTKEVTFYPPLTPMSVPREAIQSKLQMLSTGWQTTRTSLYHPKRRSGPNCKWLRRLFRKNL